MHLSVDASERLEAIAELDELGAGYQLAQRDLQIRGGGDMIGVAQHGNSSKVGYQKYCDMLADEIAKIKGLKKSYAEVQVTFPATIPGDYLPQENLRVTLYRRLLKSDSVSETEALREETSDRFGTIPPSLKFLFDLSVVRTAAPDLGITKILCSRDDTIIYCEPDSQWRELLPIQGWIARDNGIIGPGYFAGISSLSSRITSIL